MSFRRNIPRSVFLLLLFSSYGFARNHWLLNYRTSAPNLEAHLFCEDPVKWVCADYENKKKERQEKRTQLKETALSAVVSQKQFEGVSPLLTNMIKGGETHIGLEPSQLNDYVAAYQAYLKELLKLTGVKLSDINSMIEKTRDLHRRVITETKGPSQEKFQLLNRISAVEILTFDNIFSFWERQGIDWQRDTQVTTDILGTFSSLCGADGLKISGSLLSVGITKAIADKKAPRNEQVNADIMLLCPGTIFELLERKDRPLSWFHPTVAHEFGHPYDDQRFPVIYEKMKACARKEYAKIPGVDWLHLEPPERNRVFDKLFHEMVADDSTGSGLATAIENENIAGTPEALAVISEVLSGYCGEAGSKKHPSGAFRIGVSYGRHPKLRQVAGCPALTEEKAYCGRDGRFP